MRISQYDEDGVLRLGLVEGEGLYPCGFQGDMIDIIMKTPHLDPSGKAIPIDHVRFLSPVSRPSKIVAIGLNYRDHVRESKGTIPESPLVFAKFPNSLAAHQQPIVWDANVTRKVDFEAELAVVMGKTVARISESEAMDAVFGFTCGNDISARDLQFGDGQWVRGKSLDTFCPLGPWIVTADEIPDPHALSISCAVNGTIMQDSHTSQMIFRIPNLISYLSRHFTLFPGDIIMTGTPHGVGAFREPSVYLQDGDEVTVSIEGIGRLSNTCSVRSLNSTES